MDRIEAKDVVPVGSRISWSALLAGAVLAVTLFILLSVIGIAIGLTVSPSVQGEQLGIGSAVYAILVLLLSLFAGGCATTQTAVGETKAEAVRYGVLLWGVMLLAAVWLASQGFNLGFSSLLSQATRTTAQAPSDSVPEDKLREFKLSDEQIQKMREARAELRATVTNLGGDVTRQAWWTVLGLVVSMAASVAGALVGSGPTVIFRRVRGTASTPAR